MNDRTVNVPSPVLKYLEELHAQIHRMQAGKVADYIPELARADPELFGIAIVTVDGHIYQVGDSREPFPIQSVSKPFVYGISLEDCGLEEVMARVGVEPSGDAFNSISLEPGTGRPRNPMINAGAIATASLIAGKSGNTKLRRLLEMFALYTGRDLALDEAVYRSESDTGHRNRAIGHMLRNFDILTDDPLPVVELYFQQCSVSVTARDLGLMAATLANQGINPVTGKQALRGEYVESVLSVMGSCGMYDYAGEWAFRVGNCPLVRDRIHAAVGQRGGHHREVVDGHVQRALPGVDVRCHIRIEVEPLVALQEVGDALVAKVGGRLGVVDTFVHAELAPGESRKPVLDPRPLLFPGVARDQARGRHGTGVDQWVHRPGFVELDSHQGVERESRAVDAEPPSRRLVPDRLADQREDEWLGDALD
jgi:glutaminase A